MSLNMRDYGWEAGKGSRKNKHHYVGFEEFLLEETETEDKEQKMTKRKGLSRKEAAETVDNGVLATKEGLEVGDLVQYYAQSDKGGSFELRAGLLEALPKNGQVRIQPIGPKGSDKPRIAVVDLGCVITIESKYKNQETIMELKQKKAASSVPAASTATATEAPKPIKGQKAVAVAEPKTAKKGKTIEQTKFNAKLAKKADKVAKAPKAPKAPKATKEHGKTTSTAAQTWKFIKVGEATGQRATILEVLKAIGGKALRADLAAALGKKIESSQDANTVLSLKKKFLVDNGCVAIG